MLTNQCPPICPHGERPEAPAATIARLQAEVAELRQQLQARSAASGDQVAGDIAAAVAAEASSSKFVPLAATNCFGVKPCMHTTASERLDAGCTEAVWDGHYGDHPTQYTKWQLTPNLSFWKPVAPNERERFRPEIGDQCDLSDVWAVVKPVGHVTDATEAHWHRRLRGLKHSLWLSIGSSIDHDAMKEACTAFGANRAAVEAKPTDAYPLPSPLLVDYCHLARLNVTLAFVAANGIATTWLQRSASLQHQRFVEIGQQLRRLTPPFYDPPTFLTLGGMEWDFKNWRCAFPKSRSEWQLPLTILHVQVQAARAVWPHGVRAAFARTMFQPTYGTFGCPCCANESHFYHYNHLLRQAAKPENAAVYYSAASLSTRQAAPAAAANRGGTASGGEALSGRAAVCTPVHVLDLQRIMKCNNTVGSCSSRSGWSVDGLHPIRPVLLQYMSLAFNLAADLGEYCAHEPGSGNHHHGGGNHSGGSAHDGSSAHGGHAGHGHVGAASGSGDAGASSRSSGIGTVAQRVIGQALGRARRMLEVVAQR